MCDRELLDPKLLEDRLVAAFPFRHEKDEDKGREAAEENIKIVLNYLQGGDWALT